MSATEAETVVAELRAHAVPEELPKVRRRLAGDEEAFGLRMRDLFSIARAHRTMSLAGVHELLDHPAYEPRMAAFCILDFAARARLEDEQRRVLFETYLARHDRITTWDMVDRAAPWVVGGYLAGRSAEPLHELAAADEPLRRRTSITAPLLFVRRGSESDLAAGFTLAEQLAADPEPVVHNAVGIFLRHAGARAPERLASFLDRHAHVMARPALRLATTAVSRGAASPRSRRARGAGR